MVNIGIRLIIFFATKDGEALYSQQKQDWELTMAQIMNSLLGKFRLKLNKVGKTTRPFKYAAAVKSLQLCPTLCEPIVSSPPGSSVPGILQARTLEWVQI